MINSCLSEGASLILEIVVFYMLFFRKTVILEHTKVFKKLLTCVFISSLCGFLQALIEALTPYGLLSSSYRIFLITFIVHIYQVAHILSILFFLLYEYSVLGIEIKSLSLKLAIYLPMLASLIPLAVNPFTKAVFFVDETGVYRRGIFLYPLYVAGIYYFAYIMTIIYRYGKNVRNDKSISLYFLPFIVILGSIFQFFFPNYYVEDFAASILVLFSYIMIESPSDFIDSVTGLPNADSFFMNYTVSMSMNTPITLMIITVKNVADWKRELGEKLINILFVDLGLFFSDISKFARVYSLDSGVFAVSVSLDNNFANYQFTNSLLRKIDERFNSPFSFGGYKITLGAVTCVLNCPHDASNKSVMSELIKLAVSETDKTKKSVITINDLDVNISHKNDVIFSKLKRVGEDGGLEISFLPELNTKTGKFDSVKAELTLYTTEFGPIHSKSFIAVADRHGITDSLGDYVLGKLFKTIKENRFVELGINTVEIVIPVSILLQNNEAEKFRLLAEKHGISPSLICFELDKNPLTKYEGRLVQNMKDMTEAGFRFILENYGNGYTNASSLIRMPLYAVTIDRRLTEAALTSRVADNLVKCTLEFLRDFGLKIKAEHIESVEANNYATYLGFNYLQGYYFSQPLSAGNLVKFLRGDF